MTQDNGPLGDIAGKPAPEEPIIKLGDYVWVAVARGQRKKITCPDCFGTGQLDVTLKDGTTHSIDCQGCGKGYLGPQGTIELWEYEPSVEGHTITGIEQTISRPIEYRVGHSLYTADHVFASRDGAVARAALLAEQQTQDEANRLKRKERDEKTWAWNVHYHRKAIRDAEKDIAYHTQKLNVAKLHTKQEKEQESQ